MKIIKLALKFKVNIFKPKNYGHKKIFADICC